jgi:hypothetical protein
MDPEEPRMINIVCLKWGDKYGAEYVNRLYSAVVRHTTRPFRFWCLTERPAGLNPGMTVLPLIASDHLDSWWNKISLFSPDNGLPRGEQIFYIDLDTLIVDNIDDLLSVEQVPDLVVLRDFYHGIAKTAGNVGSGLMSWFHGQYDHVWNEFRRDPAAAIRSVRPHGDQAWIESQITAWYYWQDLWPDAVVSFKMHCQEGIPLGARVICYHGVPGIPESVTYHGKNWRWQLKPQPWVLDHWRD